MQHIVQHSIEKTQHLFYSASLEIPVGLLASFPTMLRVQPEQNDAAHSLDQFIVLWWHLTPGASVAEQFKFLRQHFPTAAVVAMSDVPNDLEALAVFSVMAKAYCNTHAGKEVLLKIAQVVESGGMWIGESIMQRLLNLPVAASPAPALEVSAPIAGTWDAPLTMREREVASAIGLGATNRQIAEQMGITERTVKAHVGSVLDKLHIKNRLQLALLVKDR